MKSSLLRTFFEWALITSVLMSVGFFAWYYFNSHAVRNYSVWLNNQETIMQAKEIRNRQIMGVLMTECQLYARTNADMQRLLQPKPAASAPTTPAPAAHSGTR